MPVPIQSPWPPTTFEVWQDVTRNFDVASRHGFAEWLTAHVTELRSCDAARLTDLALVYRGAQGDATAWTGILAAVKTLAVAHRARNKFQPSADDLASRVLERLAKKDGQGRVVLARYTGKGALQAWLRAVVVREAIDMTREHRDVQSLSRAGANVSDQPSPTHALAKQQLSGRLRKALRASLAKLGARERRLIRMRYVEGEGVAKIAAALGVHRTTVTRMVAEVEQRLRDLLREELRREHQMSVDEVESALRSVSLDLSGSLQSAVHDTDKE